MTKKDYEAVAKVFRTVSAGIKHDSQPAIQMLRAGIADHFAEDNPRFDRERFLAACRGEKWTAKRDGKHRNSWQSGEVHGEAAR